MVRADSCGRRGRQAPLEVSTASEGRAVIQGARQRLGSAKLDYLLSRFGFFFEDHRAMADCRAVLHLLSPEPSPKWAAHPAAPPDERAAARLSHLGARGAYRVQGPTQATRLSLERWRGWPATRLVPRPGQGPRGGGENLPGREGLPSSRFLTLSSDSSTMDGLNIDCAIIDELHSRDPRRCRARYHHRGEAALLSIHAAVLQLRGERLWWTDRFLRAPPADRAISWPCAGVLRFSREGARGAELAPTNGSRWGFLCWSRHMRRRARG